MRLTGFQLSCAFVLLAATGVCSAGEGDFKVGVRDEEIPEAGTVTYTTLTTSVNEFVFLPPPRWKREVDPKSGTILLTSSDFRSTIRVLVPAPKSEEIPVLKADELRQALLQEMAGARIVEEFPSYTSGLAGLAFDAERIVENKIQIRSRDAFFAVAGGTVRVTLVAPMDQFTARQTDLSRFLNSFRTNRRKS
jgi:hypothetical protein